MFGCRFLFFFFLAEASHFWVNFPMNEFSQSAYLLRWPISDDDQFKEETKTKQIQKKTERKKEHGQWRGARPFHWSKWQTGEQPMEIIIIHWKRETWKMTPRFDVRKCALTRQSPYLDRYVSWIKEDSINVHQLHSKPTSKLVIVAKVLKKNRPNDEAMRYHSSRNGFIFLFNSFKN